MPRIEDHLATAADLIDRSALELLSAASVLRHVAAHPETYGTEDLGRIADRLERGADMARENASAARDGAIEAASLHPFEAESRRRQIARKRGDRDTEHRISAKLTAKEADDEARWAKERAEAEDRRKGQEHSWASANKAASNENRRSGKRKPKKAEPKKAEPKGPRISLDPNAIYFRSIDRHLSKEELRTAIADAVESGESSVMRAVCRALGIERTNFTYAMTKFELTIGRVRAQLGAPAKVVADAAKAGAPDPPESPKASPKVTRRETSKSFARATKRPLF